ncbi:uncharacterized protein Gasu_62820 [Galdieria sulphuraria]|uniref:Uncharacterized protein n=1 Tax=Galdieria sulphuraria TaxID=130081 RepID=M2XQY9_GALSU|nr:uncharacterized protein Gasu_62820 [Galdieria sulphuraria]EME26063.1 hypothetical protein Gasu_62820 [Galdieria sulphuraria]|eukprot:XP_005702583.1 hypothetical protein Gasu_62820 [Galdieria sulphuraria]
MDSMFLLSSFGKCLKRKEMNSLEICSCLVHLMVRDIVSQSAQAVSLQIITQTWATNSANWTFCMESFSGSLSEMLSKQ